MILQISGAGLDMLSLGGGGGKVTSQASPGWGTLIALAKHSEWPFVVITKRAKARLVPKSLIIGISSQKCRKFQTFWRQGEEAGGLDPEGTAENVS